MVAMRSYGCDVLLKGRGFPTGRLSWKKLASHFHPIPGGAMPPFYQLAAIVAKR
jgi:hypothetical protein